MRTAYSVETVRAAERELMARLPEGALMQRAAAGLAVACAELLGRVYGSRVVLLVGSGDNGGDALYAGARLARRGAGVVAVLLSPDRAHQGGLGALRAAGGRVSDDASRDIARADLVVDGIVGIGGRGGLRPEAARLARAAWESAPVVAVDLPSGVDADSGEVRGEAVRADATVTFGAYKPGLLIDPARERAGALRLVDIGLTLPGDAETWRRCSMRTWRSCCRVRRPRATSTGAAWSGWSPGPRGIPGRRCSRWRARCGAVRGPCAMSVRPPMRCWRAFRRRWCMPGRRTRRAGCRPG